MDSRNNSSQQPAASTSSPDSSPTKEVTKKQKTSAISNSTAAIYSTYGARPSYRDRKTPAQTSYGPSISTGTLDAILERSEDNRLSYQQQGRTESSTQQILARSSNFTTTFVAPPKRTSLTERGGKFTPPRSTSPTPPVNALSKLTVNDGTAAKQDDTVEEEKTDNAVGANNDDAPAAEAEDMDDGTVDDGSSVEDPVWSSDLCEWEQDLDTLRELGYGSLNIQWVDDAGKDLVDTDDEDDEEERVDDEDSIISDIEEDDEEGIINEEELQEEVAEVEEKLLAKVPEMVVGTKTNLQVAADITKTGSATARIIKTILMNASNGEGDVIRTTISIHAGNQDIMKVVLKALVFPRDKVGGRPSKEEKDAIAKAYEPYQSSLKKLFDLKKEKQNNNTRAVRDEIKDVQEELYNTLADTVKSSIPVQKEIVKFLSACSNMTITPTDKDICMYGGGHSNIRTQLRMEGGHTTPLATAKFDEIVASIKPEELDDEEWKNTLELNLQSYVSSVREGGGRVLKGIIGSAGVVIWVEVNDSKGIKTLINLRSHKHNYTRRKQRIAEDERRQRLEFNQQNSPHRDTKEITFNGVTYPVLDPLNNDQMNEMNRRDIHRRITCRSRW